MYPPLTNQSQPREYNMLQRIKYCIKATTVKIDKIKKLAVYLKPPDV